MPTWGTFGTPRQSAARYRQYAEIIRAEADRRALEWLGREIQDDAADRGRDLAEILAAVEGRLAAIARPIEALTPISMAELVEHHPAMRPPIIDGLIREGEVLNMIAAPKFGKSWLALSMAFSVATGREWMGFPTIQGEVLIIDNELHKETLASRLRRVADAYGCFDEAKDRIQVLSLRGRLKDLHAIGSFLRTVKPGRFKLIVLDAFYRSVPKGTDENSNSGIAELYNLIDSYVDRLRCGFASIHHASKGNQAGKGITDVGSGAGSQSRAADAHLILRPHQEENVVVMEGVVRSFPPVQPKCLRWEWPFFVLAEGLDPAELAETARRRKSKSDTEAESARETAKAEKRKADDAKLLCALDTLDRDRNGANYTRIRTLADLSGTAMETASARLVGEGIIEEMSVKSSVGKGAQRSTKGLRRRNLGEPPGSSVDHRSDFPD